MGCGKFVRMVLKFSFHEVTVRFIPVVFVLKQSENKVNVTYRFLQSNIFKKNKILSM